MTGAARLAASAGALAIAGFGLGGPGLAHPHGDEDGAKTKVEKVIVIREADRKHKGKGKHQRSFRILRDGEVRGDGRIRSFHIERAGKPGDGERHVRIMRFDGDALADCGGEAIVRSETGDEKDKTKVIICSKGELSQAQRVEKIEQVLERLRTNDRLSAEQRARVTEALQRAIEEMRTTP